MKALPSKKYFHITIYIYLDSSDTLSTFQQNIQNEAILFANNNIRPNSIYLDKNFIYPKEIFNQAGKLSYGGVCGLKDYGGKESGKIGASIIFAELAEADIGLSAYISIHNMTGIVLEKYGTEELKKTYLKKLFSMESVSSYCLTEPNSGSDAISIVKFIIL